jgi:hypothetical protein
VALYRQTSPQLNEQLREFIAAALPFSSVCGALHRFFSLSSVHNLQLLRSLHQRWHLRSLPVTVGMFVKLKPLLLVRISRIQNGATLWQFKGASFDRFFGKSLIVEIISNGQDTQRVLLHYYIEAIGDATLRHGRRPGS